MKIQNLKYLFFFILFNFSIFGCKQNPYEEGERVYKAYCQNCHMEDGSGLGQLIPPVANSDYYLNEIDNLPCIIKKGITDTILVNGIPYGQGMIGIPGLTDIQIANLINYINHRWYPEQPLTNSLVVKESSEGCE